jgi:hypothetical protein
MTTAPYKLGWNPDGTSEEEYRYANVWVREKTTGPDRLLIAPAEGQVDLLLNFAEKMQQPFWLLYVLVVSRMGSELGRYEGVTELNYGELTEFLKKHKDFLERDARHHLWLSSAEDQAMLVYDNHNVIYAYGPLDLFTGILEKRGLIRADLVRFPKPHTHRYNQEFDTEERDILQAMPWHRTPLRDGDE